MHEDLHFGGGGGGGGDSYSSLSMDRSTRITMASLKGLKQLIGLVLTGLHLTT
jgi:hypothetical protein